MARVSPHQGDFGAGEFSPLLYGRVDADRYKKGLARCFNFISTLQGAATRRAGTKYVYTAKSNAYKRLIPFKFSQTDAVMMEFGATYIRFYTNRGVVLLTGTPYEVTTPYAQGDLKDLKFTQSLDTMYIVHPNHRPRKLVRNGATDWTLSKVQFIDGPYQSGTIVAGINGPRFDATMSGSDVSFAQKENVVLGVVNDGTGQCLVNLTDSVSYAKDGYWFYLEAVVGTTGANGTFKILKTADSHKVILVGSTFNSAYVSGGVAFDASFTSDRIGSLVSSTGTYDGSATCFRYKLSGSTLWRNANLSAFGVVSGGTEYSNFIANHVSDTFAGTVAVEEYKVPAYAEFGAPTGAVGTKTLRKVFPSCVAFHEDRLFFGGAGGALQKIDGSVVADYETFSPTDFAPNTSTDNGTVTDSSGLSFSFLSNEANIVKWMKSDEKGMTVGTSGGPWVVRPSSLSQALTPTNISAKKITSFGSADFEAVVAGKANIFIEASLRRVRELAYFYDIDGFRAVDLSELSEHLPAKGVSTELTFQNTPQNIVWCARADGALLGITYDRTLDNLRAGWHWHLLGGRSDTSGTPPIIESLATIPAPDGNSDDVWMSVKRYINGSTIRTIEYMTKIFESFNDLEDAFFLDCGGTYDAPVVITGLTQGSTTSIAKTSHGLSTGDRVRFRNVTGLKDSTGDSQINGFLFTITKTDNNNFTIPLNSTLLTTYVQNGNAVFRKMVTTVSGLDWLKGETVRILGDGADFGTAVVDSGGAITLPTPGAGTVQVGLNYSSELQQLRLEAGAADGTSMGKVRRINETAIMVERSGSFEFGVNFTDMIPVDVRQPSDPIDQAAPLFSGIKDKLLVQAGYDTENQIALRQNSPLPLTVLAIMPQQVTYDKG